MNLTARLGEDEIPLEVRAEGKGGYRVKVGTIDYAIDLTEPEPGVLSLLFGARSYEVVVRAEGDTLRVVVAGHSYEIALEDPALALARSSHLSLSGTQVVRSIMAGKVLAVMAREGESVAQGKALVVIEAMKMENEIRAPKAGIVRSIRVAPGQAVESGAELFRVE